MTIKLGQMTRKVPVTVLDKHEQSAELGRAFLEDLQYEQDNSSGHITLRKKGEAQGTHATQDAYKAEYAKLPDESQIRFTPGDHGEMFVDASVDGHPIKCHFDTGAAGFFGMNHLRQANISPPKGKPDSYTHGWAGRPVPVWKMTVDVKIGDMTRRIPISVAEDWSSLPLIGQDFVRDYQYTIDRAAGRMTLHKKTAASAIANAPVNSLYDVPCVFENERDYVSLDVGGRKYAHVLIDTGASNTILSLAAASQLGIEIPRGAHYVMGAGVGGSLPFAIVNVDLQLGPVTRREFPVMIGGNMGCAIGQDFMSGWRFTVDRDKKLLRFFH